MIVVDTSALLAVLLAEPEGERCAIALTEESGDILISAGTLAEALIVADRRNIGEELSQLVEVLRMTVTPVTAASAGKVREAYQAWGRGQHPAALNFGDCFAYALARERGCPLLCVGRDFARTDLVTIPRG